jgi:hypothetical protein
MNITYDPFYHGPHHPHSDGNYGHYYPYGSPMLDSEGKTRISILEKDFKRSIVPRNDGFDDED